MNSKAKVFFGVVVPMALASLGAWKGKSVAAAVDSFALAGCAVALLFVHRPGASEYIGELEDALQQSAPLAAQKVIRK